jgi:hypothetical protein
MTDISQGDTITVIVEGVEGGYCMSINDVRRCGLGFTIGRGWGLLFYSELIPSWLRGVLDVAWLVGLMLPVGFWVRRGWESAVAVGVILLAVLAVPRATVLLPTPPLELLGVALGFGAGLVLGIRPRRSHRPARGDS